MTDMSFCIDRLDVFHLEAPIGTPRRNAFGTMHARPALLVRMTASDGAQGWGEAFCNWPAFGARHRRRILEDILAPLMLGNVYASPEDLWSALTSTTRLIALQANEPGPFEQCIAALDIAAWDLVARRDSRPLYAVLSDGSPASVPVYASALTSETQERLVPSLRADGWGAFKTKVGFGLDRDLQTIDRLRGLAPGAAIMVDANQNWSIGEALDFAQAMGDDDLTWIEEPLPADTADADWQDLVAATAAPIAAGENLRGDRAFHRAATDLGIAVLQPDAVKWGGLSGLRRIADIAADADARFAPHYLGSGLGLAATAHAAAAFGAAWLEIDVTENPLREALFPMAQHVCGGNLDLSTTAPGLGVTPDPEFLERFRAPQA
ncbi:mandelate racemase/muconate lactonizing enzyme family protein [Rhodobacteraceae bacterium CCMM004]|nr:mandelate racemase/muconate lactonizing enzyme family protein [Rhodobacteraceae bacterium CCMM004]